MQTKLRKDDAPDGKLESLGTSESSGSNGSPSANQSPEVAVLIPCHNEAINIEKVVADFRKALPGATVFVYDNNSTDGTYEKALEAGAITRKEKLQGKGNVVRRMFADIEADIYVLVDGDDTYDAASAPKLVQHLVREHLDMVNGSRHTEEEEAYRTGHRFGNKLLSGLVGRIFGNRVTDMLSGYRVFSRRFVKSFPALSTGFEIETELTVHALELGMPIDEIMTPYKSRIEGSESKLNTYSDGFRILKTIGFLIKEERPLLFFGSLSGVLMIASLLLGLPIVVEFYDTGLVPRFPTAILATGLVILSFLSIGIGLILDTVTHGRREIKRLAYISKDFKWRR